MKKLISTTMAALVAAGGMMIVSADADANGRRWHRGARVGVYIGAPVIASPWWYHPRPFYGYGYGYGYGPGYYPPVVVQEQPTVYIEQPQTEAAPAPQAQAPLTQQPQYWYYCQDSKTYYPHVQTCTSPWQRVMPHAPQ